MATYFGARTPVQTFVIKIRWLIGGLVTVIVLLISSLAYIALGHSDQQGIIAVQEAAAAVPEPSIVQILVPRERIETGTKLEERQFTKIPMSTDGLLVGTILDESAIRDRYAVKLLEAGVPITAGSVASEPPFTALPIPPGYRAITIAGNAQELVDGFVRAGSRVDVLWRYTDSRGGKKIATIVRAVRVMSVAQNTNPQARTAVGKGPTTVSLIVTEQEAKEIELARSEGGISLALLGDTGLLPLKKNDPDVVSITQILKNHGEVEETLEPVREGRMEVYDPVSGTLRRFELVEGSWRMSKSGS